MNARSLFLANNVVLCKVYFELVPSWPCVYNRWYFKNRLNTAGFLPIIRSKTNVDYLLSKNAKKVDARP